MKRTMMNVTGLLAAGLLAGLTASPAQADVVNYGGALYAGVETSAPGNYNLQLNHTEDNTRIHAYEEQHRILLDRNVAYHAHNPKAYMTNGDLSGGTLSSGSNYLVNSYLIHFDPTSGARIRTARASIDFDHEIYVITHPNNDIDATDARFGFAGVTYSHGLSDRGFDLLSRDWFDIAHPSANLWRLEFEVHASTGMDEMRIIEVVDTIPTPGATALFGLGSLTALRRRR